MVERTLSATVAAYPDCGAAIWAPRRLRGISGFQMTTSRLDEDVEPVDKAAAVALDDVASLIARDMADEKARGVKTLILSEENFIGGMRKNFRSGVFYPDVAQRLAAFDSLLPMSPKAIALGVRDYGLVWTSAYHYLPQSGHLLPPVDTVRSALLDHDRGWPEVVEAVQDVWPDTQIIMWRQEDLEANTGNICARLTGVAPELIVIPEGKINARTETTPRPAVFSEDERKHLRRRYRQHIKQLEENPAVHWAAA
jgi:hypothetical protein